MLRLTFRVHYIFCWPFSAGSGIAPSGSLEVECHCEKHCEISHRAGCSIFYCIFETLCCHLQVMERIFGGTSAKTIKFRTIETVLDTDSVSEAEHDKAFKKIKKSYLWPWSHTALSDFLESLVMFSFRYAIGVQYSFNCAKFYFFQVKFLHIFSISQTQLPIVIAAFHSYTGWTSPGLITCKCLLGYHRLG